MITTTQNDNAKLKTQSAQDTTLHVKLRSSFIKIFLSSAFCVLRSALVVFSVLPLYAGSREIPRRLMALYKSSEGDTASKNLTAALLEHPLDSLGLVVDYWDLDRGLPIPKNLSPYFGIITFFRGPECQDPELYAQWIESQARKGKKILIFGDYGAFTNRATKEFVSYQTVNQAFGALGLEYRGYGSEDPKLISLAHVDPQMLAFEEPLHTEELASYHGVRSRDARNQSYLGLFRKDLPESESQLVVITPTGGYAAGDYLLYEYKQEGLLKQRWHLNPAKFLAKALNVEQEPRFDAATLNGRRLWMAHIDGDGFTTPSQFGPSCGEVIAKSILRQFPLPISASVITSEITKYPRSLEIVRELYAWPHVEPASHSASHPLDWKKPAIHPTQEVEGSLALIQKTMLPADKEVKLLAWSGLCNPSAEALKALQRFGGYNINGPNTEEGSQNRFDSRFPSRSHLSPMVRHVGSYLQFNHLAANDYVLTGSWQGDLGGYEDVLQTFEQTETPIHVYFHWYSGQNSQSLKALEKVFRWSSQQEISPVHVTNYIDLVRDFRQAQLYQEAPGRYRAVTKGHCRTVVFPDETREVDWENSQNVLGSLKRRGSLYVFLDERQEHTIALTSLSPSVKPHLVSASGWVSNWEEKEGKITFQFKAFGPSQIIVEPMKGRFEVTTGTTRDILSADQGRLEIPLLCSDTQAIRIIPVSVAQAGMLQAGPLALIGFCGSFSLWFVWKRKKEAEHL